MFAIYRTEAATLPLKSAWEQADTFGQNAIYRAVHRLNENLAAAPQEQGESRDGSQRILFEAPVAVLFEVDEPKRVVTIVRSWAYGLTTGG